MQLQVNDLKNQFENVDTSLKYVDSRLNKIDDKSSLVELELRRITAQKSNFCILIFKV